MILVDSSVWIDFLRGIRSDPCLRLIDLLNEGSALAGDLIIAEVLQGCDTEKDFRFALNRLSILPTIRIGGRNVAIRSARNFRFLRTRGFTVRKTIDSLIAARCITDGIELLHNDRDFDPFVQHLGLRSLL